MADPAVLDVLQGARIVATLPDPVDNGGWPYHLALQQIGALRACGAEVFPVDVTYSARGDLGALYDQIRRLAEFKPEVAISTPNVTQILRCRTGNFTGRDGWYVPNNLFVDNLRIPTIMIWDTPAYFFNSLRAVSLDPKESRAGVLAVLRDQINNPLYFHCALDQHHVDCLRALNVLTTPNVRVQLAHAYPNYVAQGEADAPVPDDAIVFTGNLFEPAPQLAEGAAHETLTRFRESVLAAFRADLGADYWQATERALAEIGEPLAREARLDHDQSFFWTFLAADVMAQVVTENRLDAFRAARRPVDVYGLMHSPDAVRFLDQHPHLSYKGVAHYDTGMPALYAQSRIALDVVTAHFATGVTAKILGCFAAGGLCVFNRKPAFAASFGELGEHVMFRDFDDMNAKLDRLMTHARERRELAAALKAHARAHHTWIGTAAECLAWVRRTA